MIPLVASLLNLLSVAAALGAVNAVFNWGWGASVLGLTGTDPFDAFLPVIMFSVLFGLSMDYEVFTQSAGCKKNGGASITVTSEARPDNRAGSSTQPPGGDPSVRRKANRIILAAAGGIMILVFGSFLLGGHRLLQEFGFGLAFAVLVDAGSSFVAFSSPAGMHLIGPANWVLPKWVGRALPRLDIEAQSEGSPEEHATVLSAPSGLRK